MGVLYRPHLQAQDPAYSHYAYGWTSCGAFSAAMGVDAVSQGTIVCTGQDVRALSNEPVPDKDDPGLTIAQLRAACARFGMDYTDRSGTQWNVVMSELKARKWCVINVWYPNLGAYRSQTPGEFGHSMGIMGVDSKGESTLLYDPLAHGERWVPLSIIKSAMQAWATRINSDGLLFMSSVMRVAYKDE
jgi:hypothetical protein